VSNGTNSPTSGSLTGTGLAPTQHSVSLNWNPDTSTVQGYYVYRGTQTGGPYARISSLQSATSYMDANVTSATTYYYVVTAVGTNSVESGYSNQVVAVVP
jgi:fibronectin type 3 domain-containing protein